MTTDLLVDVDRLLRTIVAPAAATPSPLVRANVPEWDSLKHVEIVFALEDRYQVQFDESEFARMDSAASIAALLRTRLAA